MENNKYTTCQILWEAQSRDQREFYSLQCLHRGQKYNKPPQKKQKEGNNKEMNKPENKETIQTIS